MDAIQKDYVRPILKLDETVVNRIAAGEVIQRPASALKELIENSLDAKSTTIQISVKAGGLKLLQIQDNGIGINKDDMTIVCERFTTSKLQKFEDLTYINTFGFRGEALASISHVAHLSITTKTAEDVCAYSASYIDSKLVGTPKPCAGNQGTQITVEELFYNVATRRKALKSPTEEFNKIAEVVGRYAVHNKNVSFSLKRHGEPIADIKTPMNSSHEDNIRIVFGTSVGNELIEVKLVCEMLKFKLHGYITNSNYSAKKITMLLFINNRLVESTSLKKSLEQVYSLYLPKGGHPFIYLSLDIDSRNLDVNVHPTKHEVFFLHEDKIIQKITEAVEQKFVGSDQSRTYFLQPKLPSSFISNTGGHEISELSEKTKLQDKNLVRTDSTVQKIDKFFNSQADNELKSQESESKDILDSPANKREVNLTSVLELKKDVEEQLHVGLQDILKDSTFVGCVNRKLALLQHQTKLYLCNTHRLCEELLYQLILYQFGNMGVIKFSNSVSLQEAALLGLNCEKSEWTEVDGPKEELANSISEILSERRDMLEDYFSVEIDHEGNICSIPLILDKFVPDIGGLPMYVTRLATEVEWDEEKPCFYTFSRETARYYSEQFDRDCNRNESDVLDKGGLNENNWRWVVEHVIYSTLKKSFLPPKSFADDATILQIANLPDLYKVFERC